MPSQALLQSSLCFNLSFLLGQILYLFNQVLEGQFICLFLRYGKVHFAYDIGFYLFIFTNYLVILYSQKCSLLHCFWFRNHEFCLLYNSEFRSLFKHNGSSFKILLKIFWESNWIGNPVSWIELNYDQGV